MNPYETIRFALRGVTANKLRSGLTVLGILIGVGAVILLVAVGNGAQVAIQKSIEALGTNTLTISSGGGRNAGASSRSTSLTPEIATTLVNESLAPDVVSASPVVTTSEDATYNGTDTTIDQFVGTVPEYLPAENYSVATGTPFTSSDVTAGRKVVLIGQTVATSLFPDGGAVGKQVVVNGTLFTVVGVLANKGSAGFADPNNVAIAPISAVRASLTGYGSVNQIVVEATNADRVDAAQNEVTSILNSQLKVTDPANEPFRVLNQTQLLSTRTDTLKTFTVLLAAVAGISLLVGGIGITNIMMVTVTERTREIGIRKALGARRRTILTQFLVEATVLSVLGGGLGVIGAVIGAQFTIAGITPAIVPSSVLLAIGVSIAVGLFFGSYPASRAASLRPIEALRYE
jgi:putative ABC transport system permease protein